VVAFVDEAITQAYEEGASDIHFETDRRGVGLKFRLDGVMAPGPRLDDVSRAEEVISRIKVLAALNITERRRPQDGRIHWHTASGDALDLRVSIMPSIFGEDAVLRLLDKTQLRNNEAAMSLSTLGFEGDTATQLRDLSMRPHGMLLITGPTGSGKTTTVYAALSEVNDGLEKIITIEDPVEYELSGVLQIPVNEQKGLTFATGLRSILRHDPDKILVGEIRDAETAQIAVQSSLTGHLVFTTVHANSLLDVLGRFHHFGIERFALASALNGVVVQRLLRRVCPHCARQRELTAAERDKLARLDVQAPERLPAPEGCGQCRQTGYKGRFVVAEVHVVDDGLRDLMVHAPSMTDLKRHVYGDGRRRLVALAVDHVRQGMTTMEEVTRVIGLA
jgi:general secretion pathway protein E